MRSRRLIIRHSMLSRGNMRAAIAVLTVLLVACGGRSEVAGTRAIATPELSFQQRAQRDLEALASAKPGPAAAIDTIDPAVREMLEKQTFYRDGPPAQVELLTAF